MSQLLRDLIRLALASCLLAAVFVWCAVAEVSANASLAADSVPQVGMESLATVQVSGAPVSLALAPVSDQLFVASGDGGEVAVYRASDLTILSTWNRGSGVWHVRSGPDPSIVTVVSGDRRGPHTIEHVRVHDGSLVASIATNLRLDAPLLSPTGERLLVIGNRADTVGIGVPHALSLSPSALTLIENKFIGINGSMFVDSARLDRCKNLVYLFTSVRGFGTDVRARDAGTFDERTVALQGAAGAAYQGNVLRIASGLAVDSIRDRVIKVTSDYSYRDPSGLHGSIRVLGRDHVLGLPRGGPVVIDERTGIAYVAGQEANPDEAQHDARPDTLIAIDLDSEAIIGSVEIGRGPHALSIDERTARVYVSNAGDATVAVIQGIRTDASEIEPVCPPAGH